MCRGILKHDINFSLSYEKNEAVLTACYFVIIILVKCHMNHWKLWIVCFYKIV